MKKIYITTPLYYVNDTPHIGHAYTTILADVLSRFYKIFDTDVFFLTGTDEHGQKVQNSAIKRNISEKEHVDEYMLRFKEMWKKLNIKYDDFIRTTEFRHTEKVKDMLKILWDKNLIYEKEYQGLYSISEERFITKKEYDSGNFKEVVELKEKNYFFKMSNYQAQLIRYIESHESFILPKSRKNEVLGFLKNPLEDLCISRPKKRLNWGIELPFDSDYVTYVWFDALLNYITAVGWNENQENFNLHWPANIHLIGKDILITHAVYWPTMLLAAGLKLPKTILAHGWWLMDGGKMSKSIGNTINPMDLIDKHGVDPVRYFLMRDMVLGLDANFNYHNFIDRYNADLANDLGNLINRVTLLIKNNFENKIPKKSNFESSDLELIKHAEKTISNLKVQLSEFKIHEAIETIITLCRKINKYLEINEPWKLIKKSDNDKNRAGSVLYIAADTIRICAQMLYPIMPSKCMETLQILGFPKNRISDLSIGALEPNISLKNIHPQFPRIIKNANN